MSIEHGCGYYSSCDINYSNHCKNRCGKTYEAVGKCGDRGLGNGNWETQVANGRWLLEYGKSQNCRW